MYCKVKNCRYASEHTTSHHQCGNCRMFGHGKIECLDENKKKELEIYFNDKINKEHECKIRDCIRKNTHSTQGHCCRYCGKKTEHMKQCPNNPVNPTDLCIDNYENFADEPIYDVENINIPLSTYDLFPAGMGCTWFVRNNSGIKEFYFMHSDSWGQYGEDGSDIPILNAFLEGYVKYTKLK